MHDAAPKYGVMICGHGSRSKSAVTEFAVLAEKLAPMFPDWPVEYGYLEFATPVIKYVGRPVVSSKARETLLRRCTATWLQLSNAK